MFQKAAAAKPVPEPKKIEKKVEEKKVVEEKKEEAPKKSLFGSAQPASNTLFGKPAEKKVDEPVVNEKKEQKESLFGGAPASKTLFGGDSTPAESKPLFGAKPAETKKSLFFSKPAEKKEEKVEEKKPESEKKAGLFSKPGSLFGGPTQGSLFSSAGSLFGKKTEDNKEGSDKPNPLFGGKSLFSGTSTFKSTGGDTNSFIKSKDTSEEEEKEKEVPTFVAVSKDPTTKLYKENIEKFTLKGGCKGTGFLSIERSNEDITPKYVRVNFRNGVGKTLFTGTLLESSKAVEVNKKPGKVQSRVTVVITGESGKAQVEPCLISFNRGDDRTKFHKEWENAVEFLK